MDDIREVLWLSKRRRSHERPVSDIGLVATVQQLRWTAVAPECDVSLTRILTSNLGPFCRLPRIPFPEAMSEERGVRL